jgi:hypothetical protein
MTSTSLQRFRCLGVATLQMISNLTDLKKSKATYSSATLQMIYYLDGYPKSSEE